MSASANAQTPPTSQPVTSRDFWDDDNTDLNEHRHRKNIPALPTVEQAIQVVNGGGLETLAYLILQVVKSRDKKLTIRAIASASAWLLESRMNFTGSATVPVAITGLDKAIREDANVEDTLDTNFEDAEPVTVGELLAVMEADADELGAYIGVLYLAGNKRVDTQNRTAFNERRKASATASIIEEPIIFVPESVYLSDDILKKVYASFLSCAALRANMTYKVVMQIDRTWMGPAQSFINMFLLLVDNGMSALRIIKEAVLKNQWIRTEFPELIPELAAANEAQNILKRAPGKERSFLKAIHGSNFVPVNYSQIDNLLGVSKETLKRVTPSYQNYGGGRVTETQLAKINKHTETNSPLVTTVSAE